MKRTHGGWVEPSNAVTRAVLGRDNEMLSPQDTVPAGEAERHPAGEPSAHDEPGAKLGDQRHSAA